MSTDSANKSSFKLFEKNTNLVFFTVLTTLILSYGIAVGFWHENSSHGSLGLINPPTPEVLKGQEIYYQEGCQYCHTQSIRSLPADINRYVDPKVYGLAVVPLANEYRFESPAMRGSSRIGPDLARIAGTELDNADKLRSLLSGKDSRVSALYHNYEHLFDCDRDMEPVFLSWKVRMMMQTRTPFSDNYQKSIFDRMENMSRGDALVSYLRSLGQKQSDTAANFYK